MSRCDLISGHEGVFVFQDVKLADVRSERDRWRCEQETATEERVRLDAEISTLKE